MRAGETWQAGKDGIWPVYRLGNLVVSQHGRADWRWVAYYNEFSSRVIAEGRATNLADAKRSSRESARSAA